MNLDWLNTPAAQPDGKIRQDAINRQAQLTKPPGALGELEIIAVELAAMQARTNPRVEKVQLVIFAADHGIALQGVSAFPQTVTSEMLKNFDRQGAAINVLAKYLDASLEVINLGTAYDPGHLEHVIDSRIATSTKDFSTQAAMTQAQFFQALNIGRQAAERAKIKQMDLFIGGEMGIGNTSSAAAVSGALLNRSAAEMVGRGTGIDNTTLSHKINLIDNALSEHQAIHHLPIEILRYYGGFEIVALVGSFIACAKMGLPVLVDGFIASTAALCANQLCKNSGQWFLYAHQSAESGHHYILDALQAKPLLNFDLRLGEASGAAIAVPILQMACELHNKMATFSDANVSEKINPVI